MHECRDRCDEECDDIDDPKGKARLQHSTPLIRPPAHIRPGPSNPDVAEISGPVIAARHGHVGAVAAGDAAQVVHGGYQCAEEGNVDEGYEAGVA